MKTNPTIALIVAAGSASRYGADVPKPYVNLMDRAVLTHVLEVFSSHPRIDAVRVVINRAHHPLYKKAAAGFTLFPPVIGGVRRQDSVRIGLEAIARVTPAHVLIHDAARPLVDVAQIDRVLDALKEAPAALPCLPVTDSIHQVETSAAKSGGQMHLLDRSQLVAAQTPQGFNFNAILEAHQRFSSEDVTDDIALAALAGMHVKCVQGSEKNIKLTTPDQFAMLEYMINDTQLPTSPSSASGADDYEIRVGQGLDVHAFEPHAPGAAEADKVITLCGLRIPHSQTLKGHSDADVALHALVDALLGAMAEGDIGQHFPPSDPTWAGADSRVFLEHACTLLTQKRGAISHVDLTIIGERPKVAPYREAMRQQLASLLQLDVGRISVKATTTETLGFLGRGEGLAAQATATIKLPVTR